jgi:hypothetical protein
MKKFLIGNNKDGYLPTDRYVTAYSFNCRSSPSDIQQWADQAVHGETFKLDRGDYLIYLEN